MADPLDDVQVAAFLLLVGEGETEAVAAAIRADPRLVHAVGPHPFWGGRPQALHLSIEAGRRDLFDLLLRAGADVDGTNDAYDDWSPLMLAINRGRDGMQAELLARGARVGLTEALLLKDDDRTEALLASEGLPTRGPNQGSILAFARTPLAIDRLLALGADASQKDRWGATPVEAMSRSGPEGRDLVRHMMARGYVVDAAALARLNDRPALEQLVSGDADIAKQPAVMMAAVDFGHHGLVRWLIDQGASVNVRTEAQSRHTALHSAAWNGDLDMVRLLVEAGADIGARDEQYDGVAEGWAEVSRTVTNNPKCLEVAAWLKSMATGA